MVAVGRITDIINKMDSVSVKNQKIQQIIKLLKFILTVDDLEIIKSTLESVIELLEEENS